VDQVGPATDDTPTSSSSGTLAVDTSNDKNANATSADATNGSHPSPPVTNGVHTHAEVAESNEDSSSSEESEGDDTQPVLKIETLDNVKLYDVYGVRIFRKDMVAGRL
jgi:hypothetical protein